MDMRGMSSQGTAADSGRRRATFEESMRNVAGPGAVAHYAAENPAINVAMTPRNIDLVNNGNGGFRPAKSIDEVVAYGDDRVARVTRGIKPESVGADGSVKPGERHALTAVFHLPLDMCEPDGTTYHPLDANGKPKDGRDGRPLVELPRLRAKAPKAMMRYFEDVLRYQTSDVIPGGRDAVHGVAINVDESRPHMQILFDPFEADARGRNPDALKSAYSKAFGRHPKDQLVKRVNKRTGKVTMQREGAAGKMERYHAGMKQYLIGRGWAIEAARDPVRHDRRQSNADFQELQDQQRAVEDDALAVGEVLAGAHVEADAVFDAQQQLDGEAAALDAERAAWDREERPRLVADARDEGREAGAAEAAQIIADARADRAAAVEERRAAERDRRAAEEARQRAEERDREAAERVNQATDEAVQKIRDAAQRAIDTMPKPDMTTDGTSDLYVHAVKSLPPYSDGSTAHDHALRRMPGLAAQLATRSKKSIKQHMNQTVAEVREERMEQARETRRTARGNGQQSGRDRGCDDGLSM